ncbi:MAG: N(G),N(G)-dimethylarginine dimethylaminohydrolase [Nocardioides sp.]|uniref:hypothetical protein n=1 Tax=Nocardioides sp. TaxID=35761 RepID=UPI002617EEB2|nr:hypothetical protein [Nocardioides sp.]MCW2832963.1 N(G),N(G)-dimethylarginine dimethylaminohydrolase [Nocardioides sp.]
MNRLALVRRPSPRLAEGLVTHIERVPVDVDLALRQWDAYVAALHAEGWETVEVPSAPECPDLEASASQAGLHVCDYARQLVDRGFAR